MEFNRVIVFIIHLFLQILGTSHLDRFITKKVVEGLAQKHRKLSSTFTKLSDESFEQWATYIPELLQEKLHKPLIKRLDDGSRITENFNSELEVLIHEVKHLLRLKDEVDIPAAAVSFYRDRDRLGQQRIMLRIAIDRYNDLREDLVSIEVPLLEPAFRQMDELLAPGESDVLWSEANVLEYLQEIESLSESIHNKVQTSKTNLRKIQSVCSRWACSEPMLDDASLPLDLSTIESTERLVAEKLHQKVNDDAVKLYNLLEENKKLFDVHDSDDAWKNYIECVDEMVTSGLLGLIQQNLQFFLQSSSSSSEKPVFMVHVVIDDQKSLQFKPALFQQSLSEQSVQEIVENLIDGIFQVAALFPRINTDHPQKQYIVIMKYIYLLFILH